MPKSYYERDRQVGPTCTFNNKDIFAKYRADVHTFIPSSGSMDTSYSRKVSRSGFDMYHTDFGECSLEVGLYVCGDNYPDVIANVNKLVNLARQCTVRYDDEPRYEFESVLTSFDMEDTGIEEYKDVTLKFVCMRRMKLKTVEASSVTQLSFMNDGAMTSGCRITVETSTQRSDFNLVLNDGDEEENDITLAQLRVNYPFMIDGIDGKVLENGVNAFLKTDLVKFPKVIPGLNKLTFNYACDCKVEFYPTFEV